MDDYINAVTDEFSTTSVETLMHLEKNVKPYILHLEEELEDAGDLLPSITMISIKKSTNGRISLIIYEIIRTIHSTGLRRLNKVERKSCYLCSRVKL